MRPLLQGLAVAAVLLGLALLATAPAGAQYQSQPSCYSYYGCNQYRPQPYYQPNYYQPNYYQQPYYQQPYYPAQKVIAQEIAVAPLIVTVPVESRGVPAQAYGAPFYYSAHEAYKEKAYLREVLREELRGILTGGTGVQQQNQVAALTQKLQPQAQTPAAPQPQAQTQAPAGDGFYPQKLVADDVTPADLQQQVIAAYNGKGGCLSCHGATGRASGPKGNEFRLVVDDGKGGVALAKLPSDKRWKTYGMSSVGAMPPTAANDANKAMEPSFLPVLLKYAIIKDQ
jgi:mono/diheme cytochrome c family protein